VYADGRGIALLLILFVVIFLSSCSSYGPKVTIESTKVTDPDGTITETDTVEGRSAVVMEMEAVDAQKEIAKEVRQVELAKLAAFGCRAPGMLHGVGDTQATTGFDIWL